MPRGPCVGIVGTRDPSDEALNYAEQLSGWLAQRGVVIVSGGAKGIDAAAHRGALAASGATLVVAPSSFDRPYPSNHDQLFRDIVAGGGGHLSLFDDGVEPRRHQFFARNAVLVALCQALIVVEAPVRSGALNAAKWARRLARTCFVVPSAPWNVRGLGCIAELQRGARALAAPQEVLDWLREQSSCVVRVPPLEAGPVGTDAPKVGEAADGNEGRGPAHVARSCGEEKAKRRSVAPSAAGSGAAARRTAQAPDEDAALASAILAAIDAGAQYVEEIAEHIGFGALRVNHALLRLTLYGDIEQGPCGEVTRARR